MPWWAWLLIGGAAGAAIVVAAFISSMSKMNW